MVEERDFGLITGNDAKINGYKEITVTTDENIVLDQSGTEVEIKLNANNFQAPITGTPGKIASFDENGNIISVDPVVINPDAPMHPKIELYGFIINMNESNPDSMITYINDNKLYSPAKMIWGYKRIVGTMGNVIYEPAEMFRYNDWENAFFIKNLRPCILRYNGTVAYDLDKNDYSKKADGTASDIVNDSFGGNAMVGIPTIWIKVDDLGDGVYKVQFSNYQLDSNFHAYAHHDNNGNIMPYTYMSLYTGWVDGNGKLRSLSGKAAAPNEINISDIITEARANNPSGTDIWDIEKFVDRNLINLLLLLISKTTDSQKAFGYGNVSGASYPSTGSDSDGVIPSGTLNSSGLFYGEIDSSSDNRGNINLAMKVFGMENWWGNVPRVVMGIMYSTWYQKVSYKLTKGTEDGSSIYGFDPTTIDDNGHGPIGWVHINNNISTYVNAQWVKNMVINPNLYMFPSGTQDASDTTYFCDGIGFGNNDICMIKFGGQSSNEQSMHIPGAFCISGDSDASGSSKWRCAALSCKPTVAT